MLRGRDRGDDRVDLGALPAGSGENASRTCALPIVIGSDQPGDSFAVSAIDGFPASARARSLYSAASAGESNACSTFACSVAFGREVRGTGQHA